MNFFSQKSIITTLLLPALGALTLYSSSSAFAAERIQKRYQSNRTSGMGGVMLTTGYYDENFFGNPARVTANPQRRITILEILAESSPETLDTISDVVNSDDPTDALAQNAGSTNHARTQIQLIGAYLPNIWGGKWSLAATPLLLNFQTDAIAHRNYEIDPATVVDVGPAITLGRKLLKDDALSVGLTAHATYRISSNEVLSLSQIIQGKELGLDEVGGNGAHVDFNLGATYVLPWKPKDITFTVGAALSNILGGKYENLGLKIDSFPDQAPLAQPRSFGFGGAAMKEKVGAFGRTQVALEFQDIGNNSEGSFFRTVHIGGETHYGVFAIRAGLNQGYISGGLGADLRFFTIDLTTYGEEMGLNMGDLQDRRYALSFGFKI